MGGTGVVTVLAFGDQPELYGLPRDPTVRWRCGSGRARSSGLGNLAISAGSSAAAVHYVRFGRKHDDEPPLTDAEASA